MRRIQRYLAGILIVILAISVVPCVRVKAEVSKDYTDISTCTIVLSKVSYTYNGEEQKPDVIVRRGNAMLENGVDYSVSYANNIDAGTATATVTGQGNYSGAVEKTFVIGKAGNSIKASDFVMTYSKSKQSFFLEAVSKSDAVLSYESDNKSVKVDSEGLVTIKAKYVGAATIKITAPATANYKETVGNITITVNPAKTTLSGVKNVKGKKIVVKWAKNASASGYEIRYSTNKKFKKNVKTVTIAKKGTVSKTIPELKKGKTYYVQIRAYKTVSKIRYYSEWSASRKVKVKK